MAAILYLTTKSRYTGRENSILGNLQNVNMQKTKFYEIKCIFLSISYFKKNVVNIDPFLKF
jgi:hypothetical protein